MTKRLRIWFCVISILVMIAAYGLSNTDYISHSAYIKTSTAAFFVNFVLMFVPRKTVDGNIK